MNRYPRTNRKLVGVAVGALAAALLSASGAPPGAVAAARRAPVAGRSSAKIHFVDFTREAGITYEHRFDGQIGMAAIASAGVAAGDFDGDGLIDLVVGALKSGQPRLFVGKSNGEFAESASSATVLSVKNTFSSALGDFDRDGDLDLVLSHWDENCRDGCGGDHLWENSGGGRFRVADSELELSGYEEDFSFTRNFADLNNDGWPDVLIAADLNTSRVFLNDQGRRFIDITEREVISDRYGMGSAIGDYDNDGDLDWFVTSNQTPGDPDDGNRLYRNRGDGTFDEVTDRARVGRGGWGWGACFADFDNDGWLDLFNVNGWFDRTDRSKLFMSRRNGRFRESSRRLGLNDNGSGRGVVCFDYDRDGDIDIFVSNHGEAPRLFRNDGGNAANFLSVRLRGGGANTQAVGARIYVTAGGITQMRELRCGSNYLSQDPVEAHFGLGTSSRIQKLRVVWPDGETKILRRVAANQFLTLIRD